MVEIPNNDCKEAILYGSDYKGKRILNSKDFTVEKNE